MHATLKTLMGITLTALVAFVSIRAENQEKRESIWLGMEIYLGMEREEVFPKLEAQYKLSQTGNKDSWILVSKHGPPYRTIGGIAFTDGKVSWLSRDWGDTYGDEAHEFARTLAGLISNLNQAGKDIAVVTSQSVDSPDIEYRSITLHFGTKKVVVNIARQRGSVGSVSIQEILE